MLFPGAGSTIQGIELTWTALAFSGTGSITAITYSRFKAFRFGQFIWLSVDLRIDANGTGASSIWISIPQMAAKPACLHGWINNGFTDAEQSGIAIVPVASLYMSTTRFDNAYWGANNNRATFSGWYEALL